MTINTLDTLDILDYSQPTLIAGPTASGKSALALALSERTGGVIVNADALQVYRCWRALSARPSEADERAAPHALYGHIECETAYSVGDWLREIAPFLKASAPPIIVGGTGLYFTSLTEGLAKIPPTDPAIRATAMARIEQGDVTGMLRELLVQDPETVEKIDQNNPMRIQRAWEVWQSTGRGLASWQRDTGAPLLPLPQANALLVDAPKDWLTPRIETRFQAMLEHGALDEARAVLPAWHEGMPAAKAIGAAELIAHLKGVITIEQATEAATIATRQYAKRQRSWFRSRMKRWTQISGPDIALKFG